MNLTAPAADKRKSKRFTYIRKADVLVGKDRVKAATVDLSSGGIGILLDKELSARECLISTGGLSIKAKVVYQGPGSPLSMSTPHIQCGLQFLASLSELQTKKLLITP